MTKNSMKKSNRHLRRVITYLVGVLVVAIVIQILILNSFNSKNANKTSLVLLNQVVSIIGDNEDTENELIETLKEDYIIRAQTVAYILESRPELEMDIAELQLVAEMLQIDEIHLFDASGKIYSGTEPKYYGYSFDSGDQMAYFKPMLDDRSLSMCQDVTPNTAEGKRMMYAITWNEAGDRMIQVGIEPVRLLEELRSNEISEVVANMPVYEDIDIWVAEADTGEICASTRDSLLGVRLEETGITATDYEEGVVQGDVLWMDGFRNYCKSMKTGEYIVVVSYSESAVARNFFLALVIEFVYLMMAGVTIACVVTWLFRANNEKNTQMAILTSMSDIYNSMHLIYLDSDKIVEYSARDEVSKIIRNTKAGAAETLKQIMQMTVVEKDCAAAMEFTDLSTLADRMQGKKVIFKELRSKAIGWYRGSFITINTDGQGRPVKVLYVTQNIDQEKRKEEELIHQSTVDELTGLYNRHAYETDIVAHGETAGEKNFVFVALDVNGLKPVNDTLGHAAGDELLIGAAGCIRRCFAPYGRVYRTGGDEFVAIIFANETQLANIKKDFSRTVAEWSGTLVKHLSVSTGYVELREGITDSIHEMAAVADRRMYVEKDAYYESHPGERRSQGAGV
jgi:diguanylate cyclase (GGDEF)-like protein